MNYLGIDIGSISISIAGIDENKEIIFTEYIRHQGAPETALKKYISNNDLSKYDYAGFTGTGGKLPAGLFEAQYINEILATAAALMQYSPETKSAIEMGGQGSKYYLVEDDTLIDFATSGLCAAGTGSFLDQQAGRLKVSITEQFGKLALQSENPPHIAGRCSVFAKSDMIHHQQIGTSDYDIIAGLCYAVTRNYKGTILEKRAIRKPVAFIGGVSLNEGVIKSFKDELNLSGDELIVPENCLHFAALGAALKVMENREQATKPSFKIEVLDRKITLKRSAEPLVFKDAESKYYDTTSKPSRITSTVGYLGVDIGSLSTNLVVIDPAGQVMARRYLMTEGRPIKTVQRGLKEIAGELDGKVNITGVGTTGSGRYLIGDILGADIVRNEITAQAKAAVFFDPTVDTIFEIGGQDSKYISLKNGTVVDFEMNKACAAGTGSFLQEQAERLDISIKDQFGNMALHSQCPVGCGERCTVFIESDIISQQQKGAPREDLVAGLAYSIVYNYLNKVVCSRKIGDHIFFQGGVAWNKGVVAAFEKVTGKKITVPPHHDVTGAIGAALLAMESVDESCKFKGFGVADIQFKQDSFVCEDCANVCTVRKITSDDGRELFYGSRCEKYDAEKDVNSKQAENNPIAWRNRLMFSYGKKKIEKPKAVIGLPRLLSNWAFWPLWSTFFNELGYKVIGSAPTNNTIIRQGMQIVGSESCFPVKVAHGHIMNLLERDADFIFLPSMINTESLPEESHQNYFCPYVQAIPYLVKSVLNEQLTEDNFLSPTIYLGYGKDLANRQIADFAKKLGVSKKKAIEAFDKARAAQKDFETKIREKGRESLENAEGIKLVLVGRPYNTCDPGLNLELPKKLAAMGATAISPDMAPVDDIPINDVYWHYGKAILRIADYINKHNDTYAVYITNFGCGPDSFISHDFYHKMAGKPYLTLEMDEHSADAGLITRAEAFIDSINSSKDIKQKAAEAPVTSKPRKGNRKIYIPPMCDLAQVLAAAMRNSGVDAEAMPESDEKTVEIGRKYTNGKECYPAVLTTGDLLKLIQTPGFDHSKAAFFMPSAGGPCRFGQYHRLHKRVLGKLGYDDVPVYSPNSNDSYEGFPGTSKQFRKLAFRGFIFGDSLFKLYMASRSRTDDLAKAKSVFEKFMQAGCQDIEAGGANLRDILQECGKEFQSIETGVEPRVKIGVVGEIYVRNNRFANNDLVAKLERAGAEVFLASFSEWINYTTFMYKMHSKMRRKYVDMIKGQIQDTIQHREERKITEPIHGMLNGNSEKPVGDILQKALPYLNRSVGGEAILSIGKAIDFVESGCGGVVNCMPFTCMPGNVVQAISTRVKGDLGDVPWLNIAYEGPGDPTEDLKIEAFVDQAEQWFKKRKKR